MNFINRLYLTLVGLVGTALPVLADATVQHDQPWEVAVFAIVCLTIILGLYGLYFYVILGFLRFCYRFITKP